MGALEEKIGLSGQTLDPLFRGHEEHNHFQGNLSFSGYQRLQILEGGVRQRRLRCFERTRREWSIGVRLQLYFGHPLTQKGEITLHISEELGLIGGLGTVMFAVLEMH
jgi:hypothetical protein